MAEHRFRCGDTARIEGADYDIEVAYADPVSGRASWFGWPEGDVATTRLTLVSACSDEEHREAVARWLDGPRPNSSDHRRDRVERLYRPRAFWRRMVTEARERLRGAIAQVESCEVEFLLAFEGPPDAQPMEVPRG